MIVAINTIRIKSGHIDEIAERFKNPQGVQHAPGFVRMELLKEAGEEHDELKVCTTWENREAFDGWVNSDAFKQAHARPKAEAAASSADSKPSHGQHPGGGSGIMLGAKLSVHDVAYTFPVA